MICRRFQKGTTKDPRNSLLRKTANNTEECCKERLSKLG